LSLFGQFGDKFFKKIGETLFVLQKRKQNYLKLVLLCHAGILYGLHIDTFVVNICAKMGHF
jgi:hypothetical protein